MNNIPAFVYYYFPFLFIRMSFQKNIAVSGAIGAILMVCIAAIPSHPDYIKKWVILKECTVRVNGSTNINKFTCSVPNYTNSDTLTCFIRSSNNATVSMTGHIAIPVFSFDCVNTMMTKDLRKTLKSKEYPIFYIHFISMKRYPVLKSVQESVSGIVNIELAGVKKQLEINYKILMDEQGIVHLAGAQSIHFSDFNLVAPRKLGGMIRANDRLDVEFNINCRIINP